jgi:hypothetical protein
MAVSIEEKKPVEDLGHNIFQIYICPIRMIWTTEVDRLFDFSGKVTTNQRISIIITQSAEALLNGDNSFHSLDLFCSKS